MNNRIAVTTENSNDFFSLEQLTSVSPIGQFRCHLDEYNDYLAKDALRSQNDHIALTWLLYDRSNILTAYMSLVADAIKLSVSEKDLHSLNYPFKTIPAIKIAKLAVAS